MEFESHIVKRKSFAVLLIVLVNLVIYAQVINFELVGLDDNYFITSNPQVTEGLSWDNFLWSLQTVFMGIWHPLTWLSYQLESSLFGADNASARHVTNLLIHIGNSLLVFFLFNRLLKHRNIALVLALLFAAHPQHVQVVAWVSERKELLAAFFALLTILFYHKSTDETQAKGWYWLSLSSFVFAAMSKPGIVPIPLILIAIDLILLPRKQGFFRSVIDSTINKIPFLIVSIVISLVAVYANHNYGAEVSDNTRVMEVVLAKFDAYAWLVPISLGHYLTTVFIPVPGSYFLIPPEHISLKLIGVSLMVAILFLSVSLQLRRRFPLAVFGALWFILMWLPVSGIIPFARYYVADRYMYMPHIGLLLLIIYAVYFIAEKFKYSKYLLLAVMLLTVASSAYFASIQASYWRNDLVLFQHEFEINQHSEEAALYCGWAAQTERRYELAAKCFKQAVIINPTGYMGHAYYGFALEHTGHPDRAADQYQRALASKGADTEINADLVYARLVKLLVYQDKRIQATSMLVKGLEVFPGNQKIIGAYYQIGQ
jgi:tetratricopeptide (TPR) repeat protein